MTNDSFSYSDEYEILQETRPQGLVRRFLITQWHLWHLFVGGAFAYIRYLKNKEHNKGIKYMLLRFVLLFVWPFADKKAIAAPFPVQFRRKMEILGPTYVKFGQILSLREDVLPKPMTDELKKLLDRLPIVPFERYRQIVEKELKAPIISLFSWLDSRPIGSASLAQVHRARLHTGEEVVLKVIKPGFREQVELDTTLLKFLGFFLQIFLAPYQPKLVIAEFCHYTLREVDLTIEANSADTFSANFKDNPDILFPKIYRKFSSRSVLCMEYFKGLKPDAEASHKLTQRDKNKLIDLGATAIMRMLYEHGFFHADLHPGNLIILEGVRAGFIDLGMVGRFDEDIRKSLLYYYYSLVMGDLSGASRFLTSIAYTGKGSDLEGFRREVEELCQRWIRAANFKDFSLGRLIMESVGLCGQYRIYFPVEMILMTKALITFEGVGNLLTPGFDVAHVSKKHIRKLFLKQFNLFGLARDSLRNAPALVDIAMRTPMVISEGMRVFEKDMKNRSHPNPLTGIKSTIFAGFCMVAGAILASSGLPWTAYGAFFAIAIILALRA